MTAMLSCPSAEELLQLLAGSLPDAEQAHLTAHLDTCTICQKALEGLTGVTPALLSAATAQPGTAFVAEAPLRRVLADLASDSQVTILHRRDNQTAWVQSFLQPAAALDVLGQLEHYEVTELLGQGGMGLVLKAFDKGLKRWVAIKVLIPHLASDAVARQRFAREAQAAAAVRHDNVVAIHQVSETNGLPFLVMEYVAGGSLQDYVNQHGRLDWQTIAHLGLEIADGLAAAHARGLVHRDIKPSNILLSAERGAFSSAERGARSAELNADDPALGAERNDDAVAFRAPRSEFRAVKIADFGLARVADDARLTQSGIVAGTPMYMAPEQAMNEPLDGRADLFSLGSVLYALCTGQEPFPAGNPVAVLRHVCETTPRPIRAVNPAIPVWLAAIIERLHAKRPADRFASAAEVAKLLRYNLEHPDHPAPLPPLRRDTLRRRRRWLVSALLVGLALLIGVGLSEALQWTHWTGWHPPGVPELAVPLRATLDDNRGPLWSVAFAPDGKTLATANDDGSVHLWDADSGKEIAELKGHRGAVFSVAFARSGQLLASGGDDGTLRIWNVAARKQEAAWRHGSGSIRRVAFSPDAQTVALGGSAEGVELWDLTSGKRREAPVGQRGSVFALAFAPDGRTLASGDAGGLIKLWDPVTGSERASFRGDSVGMRALAFAPDSQTLASTGTGDKDVKFWNVATQQLLATVGGRGAGVTTIAFAPDGRHLASGNRAGTITLWDVPSTQAVGTLRAHQGSIFSMTFSPDGRTLVSVGEDRLGKLWDMTGLTGSR